MLAAIRRAFRGCYSARLSSSEAPAPVRWFKHAASRWVDPMQLRACDAMHRLIRLRIISDRRIIGPCLQLPAGAGAAVDENGHDVRLKWVFVTTFHPPQSCSQQALVFSKRLRCDERHCRKQSASG